MNSSYAVCCLVAIEIIGHQHAFSLTDDLPDTQDDGLLPQEEFLRECAEAFSAPRETMRDTHQYFQNL